MLYLPFKTLVSFDEPMTWLSRMVGWAVWNQIRTKKAALGWNRFACIYTHHESCNYQCLENMWDWRHPIGLQEQAHLPSCCSHLCPIPSMQARLHSDNSQSLKGPVYFRSTLGIVTCIGAKPGALHAMYPEWQVATISRFSADILQVVV